MRFWALYIVWRFLVSPWTDPLYSICFITRAYISRFLWQASNKMPSCSFSVFFCPFLSFFVLFCPFFCPFFVFYSQICYKKSQISVSLHIPVVFKCRSFRPLECGLRMSCFRLKFKLIIQIKLRWTQYNKVITRNKSFCSCFVLF